MDCGWAGSGAGACLGVGVLLEQLGRDAAQRAQHGPARVDDLDLAVAREGLRVRGQARRVPACAVGGGRGLILHRMQAHP